jgi:hypothetical protein
MNKIKQKKVPIMIHQKNIVRICRFCHYSLEGTVTLPVQNPQVPPITYLICPHCKRIFDPDPRCHRDYHIASYDIYALRLKEKKGTAKIA